MIETAVTALQAAMTASRKLPRFTAPIPIVCAGGTAMAGNFLARLRAIIAETALPVAISDVYPARDPRNATAKGALVGAMLNMRADRPPPPRTRRSCGRRGGTAWISSAHRGKPARPLGQVSPMLLLIPGPSPPAPRCARRCATTSPPGTMTSARSMPGIRERVLRIARGTPGEHATLPLQGCGHFITEASIRTFVPFGSKLLIPATGSYADRMIRLAREAGRIPVPLPLSPVAATDPDAVAAALEADPDIGHVGLVYSETGSGIVHDVAAIGAVARRLGRRLIVDAVSAFGALPLDLSAQPEIDAAVFTSNKCLEGIPGMAFAIARIDRVVACAGNAGSWSLDLSSIYDACAAHGWGSFRFTPPAQVLNAFNVALDLYDAEGGQPARLARYTENMRTLYDGVRSLGLTPCLTPDVQGPIIVNVHAPADPAWDLQRFVDALKARGVLISNFYSTGTAELPRGMHRRDHSVGHDDGSRGDGRGIGQSLASSNARRRNGRMTERRRQKTCRKARAHHSSTWCRWTSPPSMRRHSTASMTPSTCRIS